MAHVGTSQSTCATVGLPAIVSRVTPMATTQHTSVIAASVQKAKTTRPRVMGRPRESASALDSRNSASRGTV